MRGTFTSHPDVLLRTFGNLSFFDSVNAQKRGKMRQKPYIRRQKPAQIDRFQLISGYFPASGVNLYKKALSVFILEMYD